MGNDAGLADGGLKVGWNRVLWDGRDQDGAMLANGVYLYKVDFKAGGKNIPVNNSKSVEKLVIIR
jgi:flagellar hook assembly protein FlgD